MFDPSYILLYVSDVARSAAFYEGLLGRQPVESSPAFALFVLQTGVKLGLWAQADVEPATKLAGGGGELAFMLESEAQVIGRHEEWRKQGVEILQNPVQMDFGFTFVGADPDQHRLRVFAPRK
jgi:catechol 2,3-dioxygenase-like lactoylglutathione lyase family enzyme